MWDYGAVPETGRSIFQLSPACGLQKRDTAHELKDHGVAVFSLYPGQVGTEGMLMAAKHDSNLDVSSLLVYFSKAHKAKQMI